MSPAKNPIPEGMNAIIPHLVVNSAAKALEFYKQAFGAKENSRAPIPDGRIMHADITIGNSHVFLNDEFPEMDGSRGPSGQSPVTLHLYVPDVDKVFNQAVSAGAKVAMPLDNMFWGDRYGVVVDPFGHRWSLATHIEDVSPEEMMRRSEAMFGQPAGR